MSVSGPQREGTSFEITSDGPRATSVYLVDYPGGNPDTVLDDVIRVSGLPQVGDPFRTRPEIEVTSVRAEAWSTDRYKVTVRWEKPDPQEQDDPNQETGEVEWSASTRLITETTRRDGRGELMKVFYAGRPQFELVSGNTGETFIGSGITGYVTAARIATADVDRALLAITAKRWERADPLPKAVRLGTGVNAETFLTMAPKTALFDGINFEEDEDGGYRVEYTFTHNPRGWAIENIIKINGLEPVDATIGNGIALHDVYPVMSFNSLGLL